MQDPDFQTAKLDPTAVFDKPEQVLEADHFTDAEKIEILQRWRYDVLELMVAAEENMLGDDDSSQRNLLQRILTLLHKLNVDVNTEGGATTKHGGDF